MDFSLEPTLVGAVFAALAVAGGGPMFGAGLQTLRLNRTTSRLSESPLADTPTGFVHTRGRVMLDSPLFSPLSVQPCAGFRIEMRGGSTRAGAVVEERRAFRIVSGDVSARVLPGKARWRVSETARRELRPGDKLSESLAALFRRSPEAFWLRRRMHAVTLIEYALTAGAECHVIGHARPARPYELPAEMELARTGTDDAARLGMSSVGAAEKRPTSGPFGFERRRPGRPFPAEVDLWMDGGKLDFMLITDAPPRPAEVTLSPWRMLGLGLGPALSLAGLLYLAHAADVLRTRGQG